MELLSDGFKDGEKRLCSADFGLAAWQMVWKNDQSLWHKVQFIRHGEVQFGIETVFGLPCLLRLMAVVDCTDGHSLKLFSDLLVSSFSFSKPFLQSVVGVGKINQSKHLIDWLQANSLVAQVKVGQQPPHISKKTSSCLTIVLNWWLNCW